MQDLMAKLQEILSTPEGQQQLNSIAGMLGANGGNPSPAPNLGFNGNGNNNATDPTPNPSAQGNGGGGGFDLSALASMLGNAGAPNSNNANANGGNAGGGFDLSALASMLGNAGAPNSNNANANGGNGGGFDLSSLGALLGGAQGGQGSAPTGDGGIPGIDMGMIMNIQRMVAGMNVNDKNTQLLNALKPHFSEKRRARVDQAISIMRMISLMPMLKETGILKGIL